MLNQTTLKLLIPILGILFWCLPSYADEPIPQEFVISGSEVQTIESSLLGRSYELYIKLPPGYAANKNSGRQYPVIYFNDAGYNWLTAVGITRAPFNHGGYEPAILVGISYAKGERAARSRVRDYTPTKDPDWHRFETGGAKQYLEFIKSEAIPLIESTYRIDSDRRTLVGHSLGGLFGAFVLLKEPTLFSDYVLSSPSFWYHDEIIFEMEANTVESKTSPRGRVFIAVGSTETPDVNGKSHDMVGQASAFAEKLRSKGYDDLEVKNVIYEGGTHLTVFPIALTEALRWLLPGDDVYGG